MSLKPGARRVQDLLNTRGYALTVTEMPESTRTSEEAAAACDCSVAQIGKLMVFRARDSGRSVLVVASGVNRVDEKKVAAALGEKVARADADFVRSATGYAIGGVAPVGHTVDPVVFLDADLMTLDRIWCAAGTPNAVFELTPEILCALTQGRVLDVRKD